MTAAALSAVGFLVLASVNKHDSADGAEELLESTMSVKSLVMLIPVAIMLVVALRTRNIFKAVTVGLITGILTGLAAGLIVPTDIVGVTDGVPTGFLAAGVTNMLGTVALVFAVFGIMGVLTEAGVLERLVEAISRGRLSDTPRGAEIAIGLGVSVTTLLFGGVNSAAMLTFGPVADEIGSRVGLHPYRRAVVMDCFAMGIACIVPVLSAYLFIGALLTSGYDTAPALSTTQIFLAMLYPLVMTVVMFVAVGTGWHRRFEGADGVAVKDPDHAYLAANQVA
ncbi:hypothetical protein GCM10020255_032600 [Rhodococcus baikonurensis]